MIRNGVMLCDGIDCDTTVDADSNEIDEWLETDDDEHHCPSCTDEALGRPA